MLLKQAKIFVDIDKCSNFQRKMKETWNWNLSFHLAEHLLLIFEYLENSFDKKVEFFHQLLDLV